ncbi:MAG: hypothetical protein ACRDRJ_00680 [Streptosporangiaceae bacterium]
MPASIKSIREDTDIRPTPEDKGLLMTITVTAYDNGLVQVDGRPINQGNPSVGYDQGHGWLGAAEHVTLKLGELRRQAAARQKARK